MTTRIHDRERDTSEAVVRSLLTEQAPDWSSLPLTSLDTSGTTNALWRVRTRADEADVVVRLPRIRSGIASIETELSLLPTLARTTLPTSVDLPSVALRGEPTDAFPLPWAIFEWIEGIDGWTGRADLDDSDEQLALDLAAAVGTISGLSGLPAPERTAGSRGGPLGPLLEEVEQWLTDPVWSASEMLDVDAIRRSAAESAEVIDSAVDPCFLHGDLIPGNFLTVDGRLSAIIDWGGAGYGDPAQDLGLAWTILDGRARTAFQEAIDTDDAAWLRARAFELEHAIGGILYYGPRGHTLADVNRRTLARILADQ